MQDAEMSPGSYQYAEAGSVPDSHVMGRRFVALLIDSIIMAFLVWWASRAFGSAQPGMDTTIPGSLINAGSVFYGVSNGYGGTTTWGIRLSPIWPLLLVFLYFSLQEALFGATVGKLAMGLCVISQDSNGIYTKLAMRGIILRNLVRFVDAISGYLVGFIVCLCSSRRRRLGDMLASTLVVTQDSVPHLAVTETQIRRRFLVLIVLFVAFIIACPLYTYAFQPPLMVQNNITDHQLFFGERISSYTLGEKNVGRDAQGQRTVTYPIQFRAVYLPTNKMHSCSGYVTFVWQWAVLSWQETNASSACKEVP